ncbi:hypothetical protein J6590_107747, partial [Homalodisca vitripennis]
TSRRAIIKPQKELVFYNTNRTGHFSLSETMLGFRLTVVSLVTRIPTFDKETDLFCYVACILEVAIRPGASEGFCHFQRSIEHNQLTRLLSGLCSEAC